MTLKEQALKHWKDNKRRLAEIDWKEWVEQPFGIRRHALFTDSPRAPRIGGDFCPFCRHYPEMCYVTTEGSIPAHIVRARCPLYDPRAPGSCCKEWRFVRDALLRPTTKSVASRAINRMIKRIEEIEDGKEINTSAED